MTTTLPENTASLDTAPRLDTVPRTAPRSASAASREPRTTPRESRRDDTRRALIAGAAAIIAEEGGDALSMRKLAARLGRSPMSLYRYFPDKNALVAAVAGADFAKIEGRHGAGSADPLADIRAFLLELAAWAREDQGRYRALFLTPTDARNPATAILRERVVAAIDAWELDGDPDVVTAVLWTATHGIALGDPASAESVIATVLAGLRARPLR